MAQLLLFLLRIGITSLEVGNRGSVSVILDYGDCLDAGGVFQREPVIGSPCVESKCLI
jgi:hypothetical protein